MLDGLRVIGVWGVLLCDSLPWFAGLAWCRLGLKAGSCEGLGSSWSLPSATA